METETPLAVFVHELDSLLDIKFEYVSAGDESWYEYDNPEIVLTVGTHTFENDGDLQFEAYRYDIELRPINYRTETEWRERREKHAHFVFRALQSTKKYHPLLVDDVQRKLAEFHPARSPEIVTPTQITVYDQKC